jgi:outer membrane protein
MLTKKNTLALSLLALIVLACGFIIFNQLTGREKTGYIVIEDVFNSFQLKKEMQRKYEKTRSASTRIIDSLQFELQTLANRLDKTKDPDKNEVVQFEQKRDEFLKKKQKTTEDLQALSNEYDKEILAQLNQYVHDYGTENGYTYIFGNDNNGSLMYAHDAVNITQNVLQYINSKYQGGAN